MEEGKAFDPNATKWFGWAWLTATLVYDFLFFFGDITAAALFVGDHSLYTIAACGWALEGAEEASVWVSVLMVCSFLSLGMLLSVIPICVAAIWKRKELPLLIFTAANMINEAILTAYVIDYNDFASDAISFASLFVVHILCNAAFSVLLLRQYRAKRAHLRQAAAGAEETITR